MKIEASFTADTLVIRQNKTWGTEFRIIYLNPDWTYKEERDFNVIDANIESITLSCSKLYAKSNEFYYE